MECRHITGKGPQRGARGTRRKVVGWGQAVDPDSHRKETKLKI